jgi:hypothetical protein
MLLAELAHGELFIQPTYVAVVMAGIIASHDLLHMLLSGLQQMRRVRRHCYMLVR